MQYRAVKNYCAIDLSSLLIPAILAESLLSELGFVTVPVDVIALARSRMDTSRYKRRALLADAPEVLDCSGLIKWAYGQKGIWIPRLSIQQHAYGIEIPVTALEAGDVLYTTGLKNFYDVDPAYSIGHAGLLTSEDTVIHAAGTHKGIIEVPRESFLKGRAFRGARRFNTSEVRTLRVPSCYDVEWSDDIKWLVVRTLALKSRLS